MYPIESGICYGVNDPKWATRFTVLVDGTEGRSATSIFECSARITKDQAARYVESSGIPVLGYYQLTPRIKAWVMDTEDNRKALMRQPTFLIEPLEDFEHVDTHIGHVTPWHRSISIEDSRRIKLTYRSVDAKAYESMTRDQLKDEGWHVCIIEGCDSKYGRIAFNDRLMLTRGLTGSEFYGHPTSTY